MACWGRRSESRLDQVITLFPWWHQANIVTSVDIISQVQRHSFERYLIRDIPTINDLSSLDNCLTKILEWGGCERVFTPVRWRQVRLSCIKWRSTFFYIFSCVHRSVGSSSSVDGCCANCVVGLAFLPSGHTTRKRHYDVRNDAITTSCARWVG